MPEHIGFLRFLVSWSANTWAERPIYQIQKIQAEDWTGRDEVRVQVIHAGDLIWVRVSARDVILNEGQAIL